MEEKEKLKIKTVFPYKKKSKINTQFISNAIIILGFFLFFLIIICLISENKELKDIIKKNNFNKNSDISFNIYNKNYVSNLIHYNNKIYETKNEIHVSYSLDSKIIYPTYISMVSGLENCNNQTNILVFHLLLSYNFNLSNIQFFETLKQNYEVKIYYYIIPNIFSKSPKWTSGTDCVYYKILLPLMFPDLERIIYLDSDTLIRKDIYEMYTWPFNDNYILGFPFYMGYIMKRYGIKKPEHYINGGCLLFNIKKIRKDNKDIDLLDLTIKRKKQWGFLEQDSINYAFYPKIGFLPLKYGIYMIGDNAAFKALSLKYIYSKINLTEGYEAVKDPGVVHFSCCWPKVWTNGTKNLFRNKNICLRYQKEFYYYANKTKFYSEIFNNLFYKKKNKIKNAKNETY